MAIRKITVLRHASAVPHEKGMSHFDDMQRSLSNKGLIECSNSYNEFEDVRFSLLLSSPAARCRSTIERVGVHGANAPVHLLLSELAYKGPDTEDGKELSRMYSEVGDAPLRAFLDIDVNKVILRRAELGWRAVGNKIEMHQAAHTLVVGHNPLVAAMGWIASMPKSNDQEMFELMGVKEAEGYTLTFDTDSNPWPRIERHFQT